MTVKIRKAVKDDSGNIIKLILALAKFEKLTPPSVSGQKRLLKDAFAKKPLFEILVAEVDGKLVAYAFYFFTYSTFKAKQTLYLEDIFVLEEYRSKGIGKKLFKKLISIAKKIKCGRMEWCVLDWNINAINFYDKIGAYPLKEWIYYRKDF